MKRSAYILSLLLCTFTLFANETLIIGEVYDAHTGLPIAAADVYLKGTHIGTATNNEGFFLLRTDLQEKRTLIVSAIGYRKQRFDILPGMQAGIDVALEERTEMLRELHVLPNNNEALSIIDSVRAHRIQNDRQYQRTTDTYNEQRHLYLSHIQSRHLERHLWQSLKEGMISTDDSTYLLPLYIANGTAELAAGALTHHTAQQTHCLLTQTDYSPFLSLTDGFANFYANTVPLFGSAFVSPLAANANLYYQFFLADSIITNGSKHYVIHFRTKNGYYPTFNGELHINHSNWAIAYIAARMPREVNLNYIHVVHIEQHFNEQHILSSESLTGVLDMAVKADSTHLFPALLTNRTLTLNDTSPTQPSSLPTDSTYLSSTQPSTHPSTLPTDSTYLSSTQPSTHTLPTPPLADTTAIQAMQQVANTPIVRTAKWLATIINTGYIPTGTAIDIGKAAEIIQVNHYEGVHLGIPLRTNEQLWKHVSLEGYIAYGFRDQAFKTMAQATFMLPSARRQLLQLRFEDHYIHSESDSYDKLLRENSIGYGEMDFTAYAFDGLPYNNANARHTAIRSRSAMLLWENDWAEGIETTIRLQTGRLDPGYTHTYFGTPNTIRTPYLFDAFRYTSLSGIIRFAWHERIADLYMQRIHLYSPYPTLFIGAELGSWVNVEPTIQNDNAYNVYGKLHLTLKQQVDFSVGGRLSYAATAGIIVGNVPYPLLAIMDGNQGYMFDPYRFTLMHNHRYAADKYLTLHAEWNGMGVLFNLIPGIRFLHLRELVECKIAYEGLRQGHYAIGTLQMLNVPYTEIGVGIGNILRVADVYSIWKLTHRDDPTAPTWAIRARIHIGL